MEHADTIVAVATASGRAGIGVVRLSGPRARQIGHEICARELSPRRATLASFLAADAVPLDQGIALYFAAPGSYTGEDVVELQGHGGPAVLQLLVQRCMELGARPAAPGEFTQRAFLNGKLDLVQAESVADLIDAASAAAVRGAMRSLSGVFSERIESIARDLLDMRVLVEAVLDFPEEELDVLRHAAIPERLQQLAGRLRDLRSQAVQGRLLREGTRAVLVGKPNVGKSSLMNRLAQEEVAIVTDVPGTTRDALRYELAIEGVPIHVVDTAGLRDSADRVERLGIERTLREIARADVVLWVTEALADASGDVDVLPSGLPASARIIHIINKIDLSGEPAKRSEAGSELTIWLSAKTGDGIELLRQGILEAAGWQGDGEAAFMARERHLAALHDCTAALERAGRSLSGLELLAEELRQAHRALGEITGAVTADDLLGEIFSRFCIGK